MKHYGLIGHPLGHSFSKAYFSEKFQREAIDACYDMFDLKNINDFPRWFSEHPGLCGLNVTIPYKEAILPFLDKCDPIAAEIGAVNTIKIMANGRLIGFNTDVMGVETTLNGIVKKNTLPNVLVLGTGGASKAVQYVLKKNGHHVHLVSRDPKKGDFTYQKLTPEILQSHLLIINATPVGMAPHINEAPLIPYEAVTPEHVLFDLVYNPEETLFLRYGREHGATTVNGMDMLLTQAEASWRIWKS